ncbi:MAG: S8 family serine peptidase [Candidatus Zixiibacteriota bacterium]
MENQDGSGAMVMPGRLEVQFETDVMPDKMTASIDRVGFGIPTLDNTLEDIEVYQMNRMFPGHNGEKADVGNVNLSRFYEIIFPEEKDLQSVIDKLLQNPYVRTAEPVYLLPVRGLIPNDPSFNVQWGPKIIQDTLAWELEKGSDTAKIAIIDSGVMFNHVDLKDNIWVNPGEDLDGDMVVFDVDDSNMVDDDGNGYDDLIGYDFFTGFSGATCYDADCSIPDNKPSDYDGHGTHVAGIAAAVTNNSTGVAGVAGGWGGGKGPNAGARIMCLRVGGYGYTPEGGYTGYVNSANVATAIDYAVDAGACVMNCSFGMSYSTAMTEALRRADSAGIPVIHAAGNDGADNPDYYDTWEDPFGAGHPLVISVAWTNSDDRKNTYSNYGTWIDLCAPGTNIYNTYCNFGSETYASLSGTSMAAPHVAGVVALIKSHMPDYGYDEIMPLILNNTDDMYSEPLWLQGKLGSGRLNAYKPLQYLPTAAFSAGPILLGQAPLTVDFTDISPNSPTTWNWDFGDGGSSEDQNPSHTYNNYGLKTVSLTVDDAYGTATETKKNLVMVTADTIRIGSLSTPPNSNIVVPVYLDNKYLNSSIIFPFKIRRPNGQPPAYPTYVRFDSASVSGLRTEYFDQVKNIYFDPVGQRFMYSMLPNTTTPGSNYLPPDTGVILKLYLYIGDPGSTETLIISDTTLSGRILELGSVVSNYVPVKIAGQITVAVCSRGDANFDGSINILDVTFLINYLYRGGPAPELYCGDANASGNLNILDATYLISYLYKGGPPPPL